jgi:hypothetical protein
MQMLLHAARHRLKGRDGRYNLLAALAAKSLSRLYWAAATIAEHDASNSFPHRQEIPMRDTKTSRKSSVNPAGGSQQINEKATRQLGGLFFKGE